ncbi:MAG TPA: sigma-70 family RNA polymerase sigma factor [Acidimicrobiales bacterium]|nr:sigma-70 family RNA polymerase sigma factor [Acidimicrobiales bacterium]
MWPEVARRLAALLRRRGVDPATSEDIVQEVATRVLLHRVPFDGADDLSRWAATVARNLAVDHFRAQRHFIEEPPEDRPAAVELASIVEQRMTLDAVREELGRLAAPQRAAVLSHLTSPAIGNRREDVRLAVQRHRARAHLKRLLKGLVGVLGGLWGGRRLARGGSNGAGLPVAALPVAAMFTVLGALLLTRPDALPSQSGPLVPVVQSPPPERHRDASQPPGAPAVTDAGHEVARPPLSPPALPALPSNVGSDDPYAPLYREVRADAPAVRSVTARVEPKKEDDRIACVDGTLKPEGACVHKGGPSARPSGPVEPPVEALVGQGNTSGIER